MQEMFSLPEEVLTQDRPFRWGQLCGWLVGWLVS